MPIPKLGSRGCDGFNVIVAWQEADGSIVVHIDNFGLGNSHRFFMTPNAEFYRKSGTPAKIARARVYVAGFGWTSFVGF